MSIDNVVASENLLQLLERLDSVLGVRGMTKRNERLVAVALQSFLFPICGLYDESYAQQLKNDLIVLRNVYIKQEVYEKIFLLGQWSTELDLIFLNVPTVFGHPSGGDLNFNIEVEVGEKAQIGTELTRLTYFKHYLERKGVKIHPILVCRGYRRWDESQKIPIIDITDLEKIVEIDPPTSLNDIPGLAYDDAASALKILEYVVTRGRFKTQKELWDNCADLRRLNNEKFLEYGRISKSDYENYNYSFLPRITTLLRKMCDKKLLSQSDGWYELNIDGRDVYATYTSFRRE